MPLTPKTTEVWAGIRTVADVESAIRPEVAQLRRTLSGYSAYTDFLRNRSGFDNLEATLQREFAPLPNLAAGDATATVNFLRNTFASFSDYTGDGSSGAALSQSSYDSYRSFLTSNGAAALDADEHIQLLTDVFDPPRTHAADGAAHTDWASFESELESNGVSASSAATTVADLQTGYTTVQAMDRDVLDASTWADFETRLTEVGLSSSAASGVVADLKTAYGSTLDSATKDSFSAVDSYSAYETYLTNHGFSATEASAFVTKLQSIYADFDAFRASVLGSDSPLAQLLGTAPDVSGASDSGAGLYVYEEAGSSAAGEAVPAGGIDIRALEVNMSELAASDVGTATDETATGDITTAALAVDTTAPQPGESVRISADLTNTTSQDRDAQARLRVDGEIVATKTPRVGAGATRTVAFVRSFAAGQYDVAINDTSPIQVTVTDISRV